VGIQPESFRFWRWPVGSSLNFRTTNPNFALVKNRNLLPHRATKLIPKTGNPLGLPFIELLSVDSTNNYALLKVQAGLAEHGAVYFANEQTSGRGQRGKIWTGTPGENIIMSVVLEPVKINVKNQFLLSMAVALGCHSFLRQWAPNDLRIKWPNDIYWKEKKLGGILIENKVKGNNLVFSVAGIGININQDHFESWIPNPVSLTEISGIKFESKALARQLCKSLEEKYTLLINGEKDALIKEFNEYLFRKNQEVQFRKGNINFLATPIEVRGDGSLITEAPELALLHTEVEWIL
jgi:BirA family biotin operon repressor/biotin-[acetyl-CoA-carboxylase] ligase